MKKALIVLLFLIISGSVVYSQCRTGTKSTFDPARNTTGNVTLKAGNQWAVFTATGNQNTDTPVYTTKFLGIGKQSFRFLIKQCVQGGNCGVGVANQYASSSQGTFLGGDANSVGVYANGQIWVQGIETIKPAALFYPGDILDIEVDAVGGNITVLRNGGSILTTSLGTLLGQELTPAVDLKLQGDSIVFNGFSSPTLAGYNVWDTVTETFGNSGAPWGPNTQINAVNYDQGGNGVGFSHTYNSGNCTAGQSYRSDFTNFNAVTFSGGTLDLGCVTTIGDFFNYTIDPVTSGSHTISMAVGEAGTGASWDLYVDNSKVVNVPVPNTGGYQTFQTISSPPFNMNAGLHVLRVQCSSLDNVAAGCGDLAFIEEPENVVVGGLACDIGPPATSIPAPAQLAGLTHCAANYDFTNTANWICQNCGANTNNTYNFSSINGNGSTVSNWLDCTTFGTGTGLWHIGIQGFPSWNGCAQYAMVTDPVIGKQVLKETQATNCNGCIVSMATQGNEGAGTVELGFGYNFYAESTYRLDQLAPTCPQNQCGPNAPAWIWSNSFSPNNGNIEVDLGELHADTPPGDPNGFASSNWINWSQGGCPDCVDSTTFGGNYPPSWTSATNYATYGTLVTTNNVGTDARWCAYVNGSLLQTQCFGIPGGLNQTNNGAITLQQSINIIISQTQSVVTPPVAWSNLVQNITLWTCPNNNNGQGRCYGQATTSNGPNGETYFAQPVNAPPPTVVLLDNTSTCLQVNANSCLRVSTTTLSGGGGSAPPSSPPITVLSATSSQCLKVSSSSCLRVQ